MHIIRLMRKNIYRKDDKASIDFYKNKDDNIHKSEARKRWDKRINVK